MHYRLYVKDTKIIMILKSSRLAYALGHRIVYYDSWNENQTLSVLLQCTTQNFAHVEYV